MCILAKKSGKAIGKAAKSVKTKKGDETKSVPKGTYLVRPLRTAEEIQDMMWAIGKTSRHAKRNQFLFLMGINTGLRISDLVKLKVKDVNKRNPKVREQKRKKVRVLFLDGIWNDIQQYIKGMDKDDYLFASQKGTNEPVTTTACYQMLDKAAKLLDRPDIGTHTMRKTFGYHYYKQTKDIVSLMEIFKHSDPAETKEYIGIREEELEESLKGFRLG